MAISLRLEIKKKGANLLVGEYVRAELALFPLDEFDVRLHSLRRERLGEQVRDVPVRVQAAELQRKRVVGISISISKKRLKQGRARARESSLAEGTPATVP